MEDKWMTQNWTTGDLNALVKNVGGEEVARKIQKGEVKVSLEEVLKVLFDKNGRRIPPQGLKSAVRDPDCSFRLVQPRMTEEVDFANRILRLHGKLGIDTGITAKSFQQEIERLLTLIRNNSQIANIANGVWLPTILVKRESDDLGTELERYLAAVGKSYLNVFPDREFRNHRKGELPNQVSIVEGSRYESVWERKKNGHVIALIFANSLQGYSTLAQREQMDSLPEGFVLSGAIEPMIMYPDTLARDYKTLGQDLAAFFWRSADYSLFFRASDAELNFGYTVYLAYAGDSYSGGLLFLGT